MTCSDTHFSPIPYNWPEEKNDRPPLASKRNWGGRRPGAGAPKGDLNALKHGRSSKYQQRLIQNMLDIPELRDTLLALGKRQRHHRQRAEGAAALLLASLFERAGEIVQDPEINQGQDNQELLQFLRTADGQLREILRKQSSGRAKTILNQACSQTLTYTLEYARRKR